MRKYEIDKEKLMKFVKDEIDRLNSKEKKDNVIYITSEKDRKIRKKFNENAAIKIQDLNQNIAYELYFEGEKFIKESE